MLQRQATGAHAAQLSRLLGLSLCSPAAHPDHSPPLPLPPDSPARLNFDPRAHNSYSGKGPARYPHPPPPRNGFKVFQWLPWNQQERPSPTCPSHRWNSCAPVRPGRPLERVLLLQPPGRLLYSLASLRCGLACVPGVAPGMRTSGRGCCPGMQRLSAGHGQGHPLPASHWGLPAGPRGPGTQLGHSG